MAAVKRAPKWQAKGGMSYERQYGPLVVRVYHRDDTACGNGVWEWFVTHFPRFVGRIPVPADLPHPHSTAHQTAVLAAVDREVKSLIRGWAK